MTGEVVVTAMMDWAVWHWVIAWTLLAFAAVGAVFVPVLIAALVLVTRRDEWQLHQGAPPSRLWSTLGVSAITVFVVGVFLLVPGAMMRHAGSIDDSALLCLPGVVGFFAGGIYGIGIRHELGISDLGSWWDRFARFVAPASIAVGTIGGFVNDVTNRVAAALGLTVGAVVVAVLGLGLFAVLSVGRR